VLKANFPRPWRTELVASAYMVVDATGFPLAYVYFDDRAETLTTGTKLTRDQARRLASNFAKVGALPVDTRS